MAKNNKKSEFPKFIFYLILLAFYSYSEFAEVKTDKQSQRSHSSSKSNLGFGNSLLNAAANNDVERLQLILHQGANVNERIGKKKLTALHVACQSGSTAAVKYLLERGAKPSLTDSYGRIPLFLALENGHEQVIEKLMESMPQLNLSDIHGYSTLHYAAKGNCLEIIKKALQAGTKINQKGAGGYTPLHYAARNGHKEAVILLRENGADVDLTMDYGWTAGDLAYNKFPWITNYLGSKQTINARRRYSPAESPFQSTTAFLPPLHKALMRPPYEPIAEILKSPDALNHLDSHGRNALSFLIAEKLFHRFDEILQTNIDINNLDKSMQTPLSRLLSGRSHELKAIKLINRGADCNQENFMGDSPLHLAIRNRLFKATKLLLEKGANIFAKNAKGETIIDEAIKTGNIAIVEILLKNGVNVLDQNIRGDTPLHVAVKAGNFAITNLLLKHGADPTIKNFTGKSVFELSKKSRDSRLTELLANRIEIEGVNPAENPPAEAILPGKF